jgi:hypothetical protein
MSTRVVPAVFPVARMSPLVLIITLLLLALPPAFLVGAVFWGAPMAVPAVFLLALYAWVWLGFRPSRFAVHEGGLQVIWPLKRLNIPREAISSARVIDRRELKREIGWGMRIGVGGLWGAFGWLWTRRRGVIRMYVTRTDHFVWIERADGRPWLLTPEDPEGFVHALSH